MHYLYILRSKKLGIYYVGRTSNLQRRLYFHNSGREKYTRRGTPWEVAFHKILETKAEAQRFERFIKRQKSRTFIEKIISGEYRLPESP